MIGSAAFACAVFFFAVGGVASLCEGGWKQGVAGLLLAVVNGILLI